MFQDTSNLMITDHLQIDEQYFFKVISKKEQQKGGFYISKEKCKKMCPKILCEYYEQKLQI